VLAVLYIGPLGICVFFSVVAINITANWRKIFVMLCFLMLLSVNASTSSYTPAVIHAAKDLSTKLKHNDTISGYYATKFDYGYYMNIYFADLGIKVTNYHETPNTTYIVSFVKLDFPGYVCIKEYKSTVEQSVGDMIYQHILGLKNEENDIPPSIFLYKKVDY
jgi:hypothetical protein